MASKRAAAPLPLSRGGEPCTRSAGVMGMLRVYPVADHEEGLWSAARGTTTALGPGPKRRPARKSLVN